MLLFSIYLIVTTINYANAGTHLDWQFQTFAAQPDNGFVASLLLSRPTAGLVLAFENAAPKNNNNGNGNNSLYIDTGTSTPGVTWEASTAPGAPTIRNGGKLLWTKKTSLLYSSPPSRTQADSAIISWDNLQGHAVVLFGGISGKQLRDDTWVYQVTSAGYYWYEEMIQTNIPKPGKRGGHALTNVGFDTPFIVMFGGANKTQVLGDTWLLTAQLVAVVPWFHWVEVGNEVGNKQPKARYLHSMASHASKPSPNISNNTIQAVMFGGCVDFKCTNLHSDAWLFSGKRNEYEIMNQVWKELIPIGNIYPTARRSHAMAYLGIKVRKVLMFGKRILFILFYLYISLTIVFFVFFCL